MLDVASMELCAEDKEILDHPLVGGIILFARNYHDQEQLNALTLEIRKAARHSIIIAVDHEGGRVQRFRQGFTQLPAMGNLLSMSADQLPAAQQLAHACGVVMAFDLLAQQIDFSFAPVLDLQGVPEVIGVRSFSSLADEVVALSTSLMQGMKSMGMATTGKHFPGHGSVKADSHIDTPIDRRSFEQIEATDMDIFKRVNQTGLLDAVMPAHVIYAEVDQHPAGFSRHWLQSILRQKMQFLGIIFSDDLSMQAATVAGNASDRAAAALDAGCDMALVCNSRSSAIHVLDNLDNQFHRPSSAASLRACHMFQPNKLIEQYRQAKTLVNEQLRNQI